MTSDENRERGAVQARTLRAQAAAGGLRFETYLPPGLADWLLDRIERGVFADPSEAVFVILGQYRELEPHADLREELLRRTVKAAIDEPHPSLSEAQVEQRVHELVDAPHAEPAVWQKTR